MFSIHPLLFGLGSGSLAIAATNRSACAAHTAPLQHPPWCLKQQRALRITLTVAAEQLSVHGIGQPPPIAASALRPHATTRTTSSTEST